MSRMIRYGKPCMTNLPPEIGRSIMETMKNAPMPNEKRINRRAKAIEDRIKKNWRKSND